jgi:hypothetical protein
MSQTDKSEQSVINDEEIQNVFTTGGFELNQVHLDTNKEAIIQNMIQQARTAEYSIRKNGNITNTKKDASSEIIGFKLNCFRAEASRAPKSPNSKVRNRVGRTCACKFALRVKTNTLSDNTISATITHANAHNHAPELNEADRHNRLSKLFNTVSETELLDTIGKYGKTGQPAGRIQDNLSAFGIHMEYQDVHNFLKRAIGKREKDGDAEQFIEQLEDLQKTGGFYRNLVDEERRLKSAAWAMEEMVTNLQLFGDLIILDTTAKRNIYNLPLFFAVVVNSEGRTKVCFCALMCDETISSFVWVLKQMKLVCNENVITQTIFSDNDAAIGNAISEVFPSVY